MAFNNIINISHSKKINERYMKIVKKQHRNIYDTYLYT